MCGWRGSRNGVTHVFTVIIIFRNNTTILLKVYVATECVCQNRHQLYVDGTRHLRKAACHTECVILFTHIATILAPSIRLTQVTYICVTQAHHILLTLILLIKMLIIDLVCIYILCRSNYFIGHRWTIARRHTHAHTIHTHHIKEQQLSHWSFSVSVESKIFG
jgi:hypothetical protein